MKMTLLSTLMNQAKHPMEIIILGELVNRGLDSGKLKLDKGQVGIISKMFSKRANEINDALLVEQKAKESEIVQPGGLVAPDGSKL